MTTIKKGEIVNTCLDVCLEDKDVTELIAAMPELLLVFGIMATKIERKIFREGN